MAFICYNKIMLKTTRQTKQSSNVLKAILTEIRLLRQELNLILPQDDLETYENPERIRRSYQNAIKKYSPYANQSN